MMMVLVGERIRKSQPNFAQNIRPLLHAIALDGAFLRRQNRACPLRTPQKRSVMSNPAQDTIGRPGLNAVAEWGAFDCACCAS
jgi:hypothetical protein